MRFEVVHIVLNMCCYVQIGCMRSVSKNRDCVSSFRGEYSSAELAYLFSDILKSEICRTVLNLFCEWKSTDEKGEGMSTMRGQGLFGTHLESLLVRRRTTCAAQDVFAKAMGSSTSNASCGGRSLHLNGCAPQERFGPVKVRRCRVRAVWLHHGAIAAPLSLVTSLTSNLMQHWWVEIETDLSDAWFVAQFTNSDLELVRCGSREEATRRGTDDVEKHITDKYSWAPTASTLSDIHIWMSNYRTDYNIASHNCQHFAEDFYRHFSLL